MRTLRAGFGLTRMLNRLKGLRGGALARPARASGRSIVLAGFPVFAGALVLVLVALIYNNTVRKTPYPGYW